MKKFKAANLEYQRRSKKDNGMAKSALAASNLAESFFLNFVVWGLLFCVIGQLLVYLSFSKGGPIIVKIGATDLPLYQIAIGLYMNVILVFFALKIFNGIEGISKK